jgi:hypothetical protein
VEAHNFILIALLRRSARGAASAALILLYLLAACPLSYGDSQTAIFAGTLAARGGGLLTVDHEGSARLRDELRLVVSEKGYTYLGLLSFIKDSPVAFVAGVNEKGLAAASKGGHSRGGGKGPRAGTVDPLPDRLLGTFGSVDEVMRSQEVFKEALGDLYIIADCKRAVAVGKGTDGRWSVAASGVGFLAFTDELRVVGPVPESAPGTDLPPLFPTWHCPPLCGGQERLRTNPEELLDVSPWKRSKDGSGTFTLSRWIISLPSKRPPELLLKVLKPDDPSNPFTINLLLDHEFWTAGIK